MLNADQRSLARVYYTSVSSSLP